MPTKPIGIFKILLIIFIGLLPYSFFQLGHKAASWQIGKQCVVDNTFTEGSRNYTCTILNP